MAQKSWLDGRTGEFCSDLDPWNELVEACPYLESADLDEALAYAAWRLEEREEALVEG